MAEAVQTRKNNIRQTAVAKNKKQSAAKTGIGNNGSGARYFTVVALIIFITWIISRGNYYNAGSGIGYNMGLLGGFSMLILLLYPLSKRFRPMQRFLPLRYWFRGHMFLGVAGPVLILLHSTFSLGSFNGAVALFAMLAVFVSGLVGRVLYTKIHHGLYGTRSTLEEMKQTLGIKAEDVHSKFYFASGVENHLHQFEVKVLQQSRSSAGKIGFYITLPFQIFSVYRSASRELRDVLKIYAKRKNWSKKQYRKRISYGKAIIRSYLKAVQKVAQFSAYERLFSYWHVFHVPLIFVLVISGAIHVLAVHMY